MIAHIMPENINAPESPSKLIDQYLVKVIKIYRILHKPGAKYSIYLYKMIRGNKIMGCLWCEISGGCYQPEAGGYTSPGRAERLLYILLNGQAVGNAAGQRHFIGIFKLSAKCNTACDGSDAAGQVRYFFLDIINGGIALDIRTEREQ